MLIIILFLLPFVVYFLGSRIFSPLRDNLLPRFAVGTALLSTAAVLLTISFFGQWTTATQIVWRGLQANNTALTIGGNREEAGIGWANGAFAPQITMTAKDDTTAELKISRAGAFVRDDARGEYLNGVEFKAGVAAETFDNLQIAYRPAYWNKAADALELQPADKSFTTRIQLPRVGKDRVYSISSLLAHKSAVDDAAAKRLVEIEKWAENKILLRVGDRNTVRILDSREIVKNCQLPCTLTLHWTNYKTPIAVFRENERLQMLYVPPWRLASPLPPGGKLVVAANPLPDDIAFQMPLGYGNKSENRRQIEIGKDANNAPVFLGSNVINGEPVPPPTLPGAPPPTVEQRLHTGTNFTSRIGVGFDDFTALLGIVNDLPAPLAIGWRLVLAWLLFALGVFLVVNPVLKNFAVRRVFFPLLAAIWNLLLFRFVLALRYAAEPNFFDDNTVKGVTIALFALSFTTGLIILTMRLRCDYLFPPQRRDSWLGFVRAFIFWICLCVTLLLQISLTPNLWANYPNRFALSYGWILVPVLVLIYLLAACWAIYYRCGYGARARFQNLLLLPLRLDVTLARRGATMWRQITAAPFKHWFWKLVLLSAAVILLIHGTTYFYQQKLVQGVAGLFLVCLLSALFWLTARFSFAEDEEPEFPSVARFFLAVLFLCIVPCAVFPFAARDSGSFYATLAIFVPTAVVVALMLPPQTGRGSFQTLFSRVLTFRGGLLAVLLFLILTAFVVLPMSNFAPGESAIRTFVFSSSDEVPAHILTADIEGKEGWALTKLENAYTHAWESRAIAQTGGWFGAGFGNAPTRFSQIRQDTLQFDSIYSFFIASEYGFFGGLLILLLYSVPLLLILLNQRWTTFNFGWAAAAIVASAFLLEALIHAAMNLGGLPPTGRGTPLLMVNSITDLLRWTFFLTFAVMILTWRDWLLEDGALDYSGDDDDDEIEDDSANQGEPTAENSDENAAENHSEDLDFLPAASGGNLWQRYGRTVSIISLLFVPSALLVLIAVCNVKIIYNPVYTEGFNWNDVLQNVKNMIDLDMIQVDANKKLVPNFKDYNVPDGSLIRQEILRFNALPDAEREDSYAPQEIKTRFEGVQSVAQFNELMADLRRDKTTDSRIRRPSLFRLLKPERVSNGETIEEIGNFRVVVNPAFNTQIGFNASQNPDLLPQITFRDGKTKIVGSAWIAGRRVTVVDPRSGVPWLRRLARAAEADWNKTITADGKKGSQMFAALTLDQKLHEAAAEFTLDKGLELHRGLFTAATPTPKDQKPAAATLEKPKGENALPPRIALTVINLPRGETLALGGYPRATSFNYWRKIDKDGKEQLPPAEWVEREAPEVIRQLFGGDRNFERLVIGSTTKPLLASAILSLKPNLDQKLAVRGADGYEADVFGVNVAPPEKAWRVDNTGSGWVNFPRFLAASSNRYQIRLGFLGLAAMDNNNFAAEVKTASPKESLDGGKTVWGKFPQFPELALSAQTPLQISNVEKTPLARRLEEMYLINTGKPRFDRRYSFWTRNEADDILPEDGALFSAPRASKLFAALAPDRADFEFGQINTPRNYVAFLLGGRANRWSNVELAAAFGSCLSGNPVAANIVKSAEPFKFSETHNGFAAVAPKLRAGLLNVVTAGTATEPLQSVSVGNTNALEYFKFLNRSGFQVYAKTGTLASELQGRYTSRIVLAIVKWEDAEQTKIRSGVVISLVAEQAEQGQATKWLGEFVLKNRVEIERLMNETQPPPPQ